MDRCIICNDSSIRPRSDSSWLIYDCLARCLEVVIDNEIMTEVEKLGDDKSLLSIYFRQNNSKRTEEKVLNKDNFDKVMEEISSLMPSTVSEAQNRIIEYVGNMSGLIGVAVQAGPHINLDLRMKATTFNFIRDHLKKDGSLEMTGGGNYLLTPKGWKRYEEIYSKHLNSKQAFIAMNFDKNCIDLWKKGIKPAFDNTDFQPYRVDEDRHIDNINNKIIAEIRKSRFVVADFTGHKYGVYFEAGFAMGLGIPVIWLCRESDFGQTHFDTKPFNHIVWKDYDQLKEELHWSIKANIV